MRSPVTVAVLSRFSVFRAAALAVLAGVVITPLAGCSSSETSPPPTGGAATSWDDRPIEPRFKALAAAFDEERTKLGASGAAIAILEHGEISFARGFGTKGPSSEKKVRAETLFRIGSMTKGLTAAASLTLVEQKKLSLSAPITQVVPDLALDAPELAQVNLHLLLSHQAGLVDLTAYTGRSDDDGLSDYFTGSEFRTAAYFQSPPGTFYNYSNTNFDIAGLAVERASGQPFRLYLHDHLFAPLGMNRTFFSPADVIADGDYSFGESSQEGAPGVLGPNDVDVAWSRPDGGAFSSVLDMARWVQFLQVGEPSVMADSRQNNLVSGHVYLGDAGKQTSYGYGVVVGTGLSTDGNDWRTTKVVFHNGRVPGFEGQFLTLPETGFGIVILANAEVSFLTTVVLALESFGELPQSVSPPNDISPDPTKFSQYTGTYVDPHVAGEIVATTSGDSVDISIPAFDEASVPYDKALVPTGSDSFFLSVAGEPTEVTFFPDDTGTYVWLRTREAVGKRVVPLRVAHTIAGVSVSPSRNALVRGWTAESYRIEYANLSRRIGAVLDRSWALASQVAGSRGAI